MRFWSKSCSENELAGAARNLEDPHLCPLPHAGEWAFGRGEKYFALSLGLREVQRVDFELSQLRHNLLGK